MQSRSRSHSPTHSAEFRTGDQVPMPERGGPTKTVLQLRGQGDQRLVTVLPSPLRVTATDRTIESLEMSYKAIYH